MISHVLSFSFHFYKATFVQLGAYRISTTWLCITYIIKHIFLHYTAYISCNYKNEMPRNLPRNRLIVPCNAAQFFASATQFPNFFPWNSRRPVWCNRGAFHWGVPNWGHPSHCKRVPTVYGPCWGPCCNYGVALYGVATQQGASLTLQDGPQCICSVWRCLLSWESTLWDVLNRGHQLWWGRVTAVHVLCGGACCNKGQGSSFALQEGPYCIFLVEVLVAIMGEHSIGWTQQEPSFALKEGPYFTCTLWRCLL